MKLTTKSVHIVASVAHLKYLYYIYIYIKYLCAKFTCLRLHNAHILFSVSKMFRVNSIEGFCFMQMKIMLNSIHYFLK